MDDIVESLEALLGDAVHVRVSHDLPGEKEILPRDGVRWIFLAR